MIEKELKPMALKSREYYRSITSINFEPVEIKDYSNKLVYRKGDTMIKKRLFRKPKVITVTEDLYKDDGCLVNAKELLKSHWTIRYNEEKGIFYRPAEVTVHSKELTKSHKFNSNEEAEAFIKGLKEKCAKCGNELL